MPNNIILRPVFNRPEMLHMSIEYEIKAREKFGKTSKLTTVFLVEYNSPPQTLEIIKKYPYGKYIIEREKSYGLTPNILEGMKTAFNMAEDFVIYIEDDILVHETYFKYLKRILSMSNLSNYSVISPYNFDNSGSVKLIRKAHHYAALAPLIGKKFFVNHVLPCIGPHYYKDSKSRDKFVKALNDKYKDYQASKRYKYNSPAHNEQAGLINRLVDVAMIEEEMYVIMPRVNRQIHIGFYGKNRPGMGLPGRDFSEKLNNLRDIVNNNKFFEMTQAKNYNDYLPFSDKLNDWDGSLFVEGEIDINLAGRKW